MRLIYTSPSGSKDRSANQQQHSSLGYISNDCQCLIIYYRHTTDCFQILVVTQRCFPFYYVTHLAEAITRRFEKLLWSLSCVQRRNLKHHVDSAPAFSARIKRLITLYSVISYRWTRDGIEGYRSAGPNPCTQPRAGSPVG
jgi:hypothetical protein